MDGKGKKWGIAEAVGQGLRGEIRARVKPAGEGSELCRWKRHLTPCTDLVMMVQAEAPPAAGPSEAGFCSPLSSAFWGCPSNSSVSPSAWRRYDGAAQPKSGYHIQARQALTPRLQRLLDLPGCCCHCPLCLSLPCKEETF